MSQKFLSDVTLSTVTAGSMLKLDANGKIVEAVDGTDYISTSSTGYWTASSGSGIYYSDDVRIGTYQTTIAPDAKLHVFDYQTTDPKLLIEDGNTGDASMQFKVSTQSYTIGIDNSDSDKFVLSAGSVLGTGNLLEITSGGLAAFQDSVLVKGTLYVNNQEQIQQGDTEKIATFQNLGTERGYFEVTDTGKGYFYADGFKTGATTVGFLKSDGTVESGSLSDFAAANHTHSSLSGTSNDLITITSTYQADQGEAVIQFNNGSTEIGRFDTGGYLQAVGFKTATAATGFLKADGTVDTSTYVSSSHNHDSDYVSILGGYYDSDFAWDGTHDFQNVIKVSGASATTTNTTALFYGTGGTVEKRGLGTAAFAATTDFDAAGTGASEASGVQDNLDSFAGSLGTAAYTASTDYATASHTHSISTGNSGYIEAGGNNAAVFSITSRDRRAIKDLPRTYPRGLYLDFKNQDIFPEIEESGYRGQMIWRSYGSETDLSGGQPLQMVYTQSGNLYFRLGTGLDTWQEEFQHIATRQWVSDQSYLTSLPAHEHDARYYTETEMDTFLSGKLSTSGGVLSGALNVLYDDHANGTGWDKNLFIGTSDDLGLAGAFPTYVPSGSYGFFSHAYSDGVFIGSVPTAAGSSNYYATIAWGDDATEYFQFLYKGTQVARLDTVGRFYAYGGNSEQWNTAYGWGNHASAGYITSYTETDTLATVAARGNVSNTALAVEDNDPSDHWAFRVNTNGSNNSGFWTTDQDVRILLRNNSGNIKVDLRPDGISYFYNALQASSTFGASGTATFDGVVNLNSGVNFNGVNGQNFTVNTDGDRIIWDFQRNGTRRMSFYHTANQETFNFAFQSGSNLQINGNRILTTADSSSFADGTTYQTYGTGNNGWLMPDYNNNTSNFMRMYYDDGSREFRMYSNHGTASGEARIALYDGGVFNTLSSTNIAEFKTAYSWGNHASAGYAPNEELGNLTTTVTGNTTQIASNRTAILDKLSISGGTMTGALTVTNAATGILVNSSGHASLRLDRGSTSYDANVLFLTGGSLKWRMWMDGSDDYLYIRDEVSGNNMMTFQRNSGVTVNKNFYVGTDGGGANIIQSAVAGWGDVLKVRRGGADVWQLQDVSGNAQITTKLYTTNDIISQGSSVYATGGTSNGKNIRMYANDSWAYLTTNVGKYYLNAEVRVDGGKIGSYNEDLQLAASGTTKVIVADGLGHMFPVNDRTQWLGREQNRWQIVFCEILDSAGQHEKNLQNPEGEKSVGEYETGTVLVWKGGKNVPCTEAADHMRMGIAVKGIDSPLIQGAEPVLVTGSVNEGDYLVTSSVEGHAKAITPQFMRQHGLYDCVLGKALESAEGKSHLVKTWINI